MAENKTINLNDLLNEAKDEVEVKETVDVAAKEVKENKQPKTLDMENLQSVDLSQLVPSGKEDPTEKARAELMNDLDNAIEEVKIRRFLPAMEEAKEMQEEYFMRLDSGEKDPKVVSKYDVSLELNPNLNDKEVEAIRKKRKLEEENADISLDDLETIDEQELEDINETTEEEPKKEVTVKRVIKKDQSVDIDDEVIDLEDSKKEEFTEETEEENHLDDGEIIDDELYEDLGLTEELEEEERERDEKRNEEALKEFREVLRTRIKKISTDKPDISKYKIKTKTMSYSNLLKQSTSDKKVTYREWGLFASGISISMSPLSAIELDDINPYEKPINSIARSRTVFNTIYRHLSPACRNNMDMEQWAKSINFLDIDHLYFAIYNACFKDINILPYSCPKCKHYFFEDRDIMDMVKFNSDEDKKTFEKVIKQDPSMPTEVEEEIYVANDKIAFGFVVPKIYNALFEEQLLDKDFREKYAGIINVTHCISNIYSIDQENEELIPIKFKVDKNDINKTYRYRILSVYKILNTFSTYESNQFNKYLSEFIRENNKNISISYHIPGTKCPKCGHEIEELPITANELVFTRHQLIRMAN